MSLVSIVQNTSSSPFSLSTNPGQVLKSTNIENLKITTQNYDPKKKKRNTLWNIEVPKFCVEKETVYGTCSGHQNENSCGPTNKLSKNRVQKSPYFPRETQLLISFTANTNFLKIKMKLFHLHKT